MGSSWLLWRLIAFVPIGRPHIVTDSAVMVLR